MKQPRITLMVAAIGTAAASLLLAVTLNGDGFAQPLVMALFAAALFAVHKLPVQIVHRTETEVVRFEEAVLLPLVLMLPMNEALVAVAVGVAIGEVWTRAPFVKIAFNVAQMTLSVGACLAVVAATVGQAPGLSQESVAAAVCGLAAMFVVNSTLVSLVVSIAGEDRFRDVLLDDLALRAVMWTTTVSFGLLLVTPAFVAPALLPVAFIPLVVLHRSYRANAERVREDNRLRSLHQHTQRLTEQLVVDEVAQRLVGSARELLDADVAELAFEDNDLVWLATRDRHELVRGADLRADRREPAEEIQVPVGGRAAPSAILYVRRLRRTGTQRSQMSERDEVLLRMLVAHAETAWENAGLFSRVQAEKRLLAQIFEHSSEGLVLLSGDGRVLTWNPAMERMTGHKARDVIGSAAGLVAPVLERVVGEHGAGVVAGGVSHRDGSRSDVEAAFCPIPQREVTGAATWVVVVRDVTAEREARRLKDDFVATVSHELRTPLTSIRGFLDTLCREDIELDDAQRAQFLSIMGEQADRLNHLIEDLLDMSAIEAGREPRVEPQDLDPAAEVRRAVEAFLVSRPDADVSLQMHDLGVHVQADAHRLQQVLSNLLENAFKHGDGSAIDVRTTSEQGELRIAIRDRGRGIASRDLDRIFDRFFYTTDSVTRTGGGAGLGLYISKRLIEAMGGSIEVDSAPGRGSTFTIVLPCVAGTIGQSGPDAGNRLRVVPRVS